MANNPLIKAGLLPQEPKPTQVTQRGSGEFKSPYPDYKYFGIPDAPEGLQYTDKLSKDAQDYFQKRQSLIAYANNMWKNYKIDVTNPDASNPMAVIASQTFNQEVGNLMYGIDRSKEGQKIYTEMLPRYMDNTFAPSQAVGSTPASQLSPDQLGYSMEVAPELKFAAQGINRQFDTGTDYRNAQTDAGLMQGQFADVNASGSAGVQARAAQTLNPGYNVQSGASGSGQNPVAGMVTEWGQLSAGAHPSFSLTQRVGPGGSFLSESTGNAFVGKSFGKYQDATTQVVRDFIIEKIIKDNDTGEVYAVNDAGFKKVLPKENIDVSLRQVIPSSSMNEYEKYLQENSKYLPRTTGQGGLSTYTLPSSLFVPQKDAQAAQASQTQAGVLKSQAQMIAQEISNKLDLLDSSFWNRWNPFSDAPSELEFDSDKGKIVVTKKDEGYEVKINDEYRRDPKTKRIAQMSKPDISNLLTEANVIGMKLRGSDGKEVKQGKFPLPEGQPEIITQNGYEYKWNPETGEYQ